MLFAVIPQVLANNAQTEEESLAVVRDGEPTAAVVVSQHADSQTIQSAEKLVEYVEKSTGAALPLIFDNSGLSDFEAANYETQIYIGEEFLSAQGQASLLDGLQDDGYVISQNGTSVTIAGPSTWGTSFGVNEFLERYVGVRWLMPGEDWEDVPSHQSLFIPAGEQVREEPAFFSRAFEEHGGSPLYTEWKFNNQMRGHVEFTHNLYNLFPPAQYAETHPHFYAENAPLDNPNSWQPCFTAEGIVDEAINNINAYFDANPQATSYSIGINDTMTFCESDPSHPDYPGKFNSLGMVDMSDIYFTWVNEVAEGVFAEHPDKRLGTYAYFNIYDPPSEHIDIDPRVVIYITDERLTWAQEDMREAGHELTEAWLETGATVAFYEYLYGTYYTVPRTYFDVMAESYVYAAESGVEAFYSELYPNWGEGPKPWLSTKLQWDPYQDVDALLDEWYERAVGEAAKDDLRSYYEIWQQFWENDAFETSWYQQWRAITPRDNFLPLWQSGYLEAVSEEDIAESRRLLESVVEKAETPQQQKRAEDLLLMFDYYEASALSYPKPGQVADPTNEDEAMALLDEVIERTERYQLRFELFDQIAESPVLRISGSPLSWQTITSQELLAIGGWIESNPDGATSVRVGELATTADSPEIREITNSILGAAFGVAVLNPGFEDGFAGWFQFPDTRAEITNDANSGDHAMRVGASSREQAVFLEKGKTYELSFYGKISGSSTELNLVGINFWDVPGVGLIGERVTVDSDEYEQYTITFTPPEEYSRATIVVWKDSGPGGVYVDDFVLRDLDDDPEPVVDVATILETLADHRSEVESESVYRSMELHLTAVAHFENQGAANKSIQHMEGFQFLIGQLSNHELIPEQLYNDLLTQSQSLIQHWQ